MEYIYYIIKLFNSTYNYKKRRKIIKNSTKNNKICYTYIEINIL